MDKLEQIKLGQVEFKVLVLCMADTCMIPGTKWSPEHCLECPLGKGNGIAPKHCQLLPQTQEKTKRFLSIGNGAQNLGQLCISSWK